MSKKLVQQLVDALNSAHRHLDWCGYGSPWEQESAVAQKLPEKIQATLDAAKAAGYTPKEERV